MRLHEDSYLILWQESSKGVRRLQAFINACNQNPAGVQAAATTLHIQNLCATAAITQGVSAWPRLQHLVLDGCALWDDPFAGLPAMAQLRTLTIRHCVTDVLPRPPCDITKAPFRLWSVADLNAAVVSLLKHLPACTSLTSLTIIDHSPEDERNMVQALSIADLDGLSTLTKLSKLHLDMAGPEVSVIWGSPLPPGLTALASLTLLTNDYDPECLEGWLQPSYSSLKAVTFRAVEQEMFDALLRLDRAVDVTVTSAGQATTCQMCPVPCPPSSFKT
mmetsp:Transcript_12193/g.29707  ORF Transcript_12193/g.29707 Transcript_12193/m.29707 type:complete len:276 (+) Transcript_12193:282-1109(+)